MRALRISLHVFLLCAFLTVADMCFDFEGFTVKLCCNFCLAPLLLMPIHSSVGICVIFLPGHDVLSCLSELDACICDALYGSLPWSFELSMALARVLWHCGELIKIPPKAFSEVCRMHATALCSVKRSALYSGCPELTAR